jgi:putative glycosyltransferase
MKLSVVSTLYRSAATIEEFCQRALAAAGAVSDDVELVLVNDGSPDDSLARALALQASDPRIAVVDLARNFGHHKAIMTGLAHASGELVFLIDSDLDEEPELLGRFLARLMAENCDVVYGVQERRRGGWFERATGSLYFTLLDSLSDEQIPRNLMTVRLMTREYVRALVRHRDREFVISHLWAQSGFRQVALPSRKLSRSPTTYTMRLRLEIAIKHVTTTSTKLLYFILYLGLLVSSISAAIIVYYIARYMFFGIAADGFTSIIVSIWFFGGLTTLILGVLGIYVANILSESKRRPYTVVRRVYRSGHADAEVSNVIRAPMAGTRARE